MKPHRVRPVLVTGILVALAATAWLFFAPPLMGGSTSYVITHGISMEPRFHTGDLALVRPAAQYTVGEIVAYHSSLLHEVVLHRIYAIHDGHYTFKGDNNHFLDPVHPTRSAIVGKLWLHLPDGGKWLSALHTPVTAGILMGLLGLVLVLGTGEKQRRRRRRKRPGPGPAGPGGAPVSAMGKRVAGAVDRRALLIAAGVSGAVALVALGIALLAFAKPARKPSPQGLPYTQSLRFGYHATTRPGAVYPSGVVTTGDPIFVQLVHRLDLSANYQLASASLPLVRGTEHLSLTLSGPTGWSRTLALTPTQPFTGDHFTAHAVLNLPALLGLLSQVGSETGIAASDYTAVVTAKVKVHGLLGDQPLKTAFAPPVTFQLGALQMQPGNGSAGTGGTPASFDHTQPGAISTGATVPNTLSVAGMSVGIGALRFLAPLAVLIALSGGLALLTVAARTPAFGEAARIRSKYGHMIVPITAGHDLGWPAIDVGSMKALAQLAQASGQLILHNHDDETDTYLVNDEGTVYRYQVRLPKIVWGEWSTPSTKLAA